MKNRILGAIAVLEHGNGGKPSRAGGQAQRILSLVNITAYRLASWAVFLLYAENRLQGVDTVVKDSESKRNGNNKTFSSHVDRYMQETRKTFMSVSGTLGLICAALPPALMFAFASHHALVPLIGHYGALTVAVALAIALEATGVKVAHIALDFFATWREGDREALTGFITATTLTGIYLASGAIAIIQFDDNPTIRLAGLLSYAVAAIMYIGSGLEMMLHSRKTGAFAQMRQQVDVWQSKAKDRQTRLQAITQSLEAVEENKSSKCKQDCRPGKQSKPAGKASKRIRKA